MEDPLQIRLRGLTSGDLAFANAVEWYGDTLTARYIFLSMWRMRMLRIKRSAS